MTRPDEHTDILLPLAAKGSVTMQPLIASLRTAMVLSVLALAGCSSGTGGTNHAPSANTRNTPADAVNRYVNAADSGNVASAAAATCQIHRAEIESAGIQNLVLGNRSGTPRRDHEYTLTLGSATTAGDAADVPVDIAYQQDGAIKTDHAVFHVVRENGVWLVCEIHGFGAG